MQGTDPCSHAVSHLVKFLLVGQTEVVLMGVPMEFFSDLPLWVICRSHSSLTSAERVMHGILMAIIGGAGSATATLIAF